jgi:acetyl-CoA decarbonylase/synthase complex subunit gamma
LSRRRAASRKPFILMSAEPATLAAGAQAAAGSQPLLYAADETNWEALAQVALAARAPLAVRADSLDQLVTLIEALKKAGVEDLVLDPLAREAGVSLARLTQIRRLAVKKNFRALGYPVITFPRKRPAPTARCSRAARHMPVHRAGAL